MFYKLSITAELERVEQMFNAKFKYPFLYESEPIINGLQEQSIPIIRNTSPKEINHAIWGILPPDFREDWEDFQTLDNTLNIDVDDLNKRQWVKDISEYNRCSILVTGFFTSFMHKGEVYPFYVYRKDKHPFALAGIYTKLEDGFFTTTVLTSQTENRYKSIHNLGNSMPIVLDDITSQFWLQGKGEINRELLKDFVSPELKAHPISKEFFKNNIIFDDILKPAHYQKLPLLSLK
ncbi:SOS response-associated peptidase family protein [Winogradskyella maritima]|uniref:Abasic site processing protein n=1 Tax=Winogradskyella maritima TaxID=1517766 RepID=A0ABV8AMN9_9FLAO|nr:SOS response-associated peptidase family protein [Winogradskyella maritima]